MIVNAIVKVLICPDCHNPLLKDSHALSCSGCRARFRTIQGIPLLSGKGLSKFKSIERDFFEKEFNVKAQYSFVESDWDKNTFGLLDFMKFFDEFPKNARILEIGAGNGQYSLILNKKGFRNTTVTDISVSGLAAAMNYSEKRIKNTSGNFFVCDAENLPFADGSFDIVFLTAALHHLPDPAKGIAEMKRCVRKGGFVIVAVEPNSWFYYIVRPIAKLLRIRRINSSRDSFSIGDEETKGFSMRALKAYFRSCGLTVKNTQRVWYLTGIMYYLPDFMKRLFNLSVPISPRFRLITLKIDRIIARIPLINTLSFHNTVVGVIE